MFQMFKKQNPISLPQWPHWTETPETITVTGRHLTPRRFRLASALGLATAIFMAVSPWWGHKSPFANGIYELSGSVSSLMSNGTKPEGLDEHTAYVLMGIVFLLFSPVIQIVSRWLYGIVLARRTTVRFTVDHVVVRRQRFPRLFGTEIVFLVEQHPDLAKISEGIWREADQGRMLAKFAIETAMNSRLLSMQYGLRTVRVASFAKPDDAEAFSMMCTIAVSQVLTKPRRAFPVLPLGEKAST